MFKVVIFQQFSKILNDIFTVILNFYHLQFGRSTETANESVYTNIVALNVLVNYVINLNFYMFHVPYIDQTYN